MGTAKRLRDELRDAGISDAAVRAAWPGWWSDEAETSLSAVNELRFTLARRLGIKPEPLLGDRVEFVLNNGAWFKGLRAESEAAQAALASFGVAVGRLLLRATRGSTVDGINNLHASRIREAVLSSRPTVDLSGLLALCWGVGIPVIHLHVFPLNAKSMEAMVVHIGGRYAVLLGKKASYPPVTAFTLAHEIGHVALGHLSGTSLFVDADHLVTRGRDDDEEGADRYALELLTGSPEPLVVSSAGRFNSAQLADAAMRSGAASRVEPGTLALCLAYRTGDWPVAMAALRHIYQGPSPVSDMVNGVARSQLEWSSLSDDSAEYLSAVLGGAT